MQRTCPHLAPILRRCGAELAHCIRLHNFVAEIWLSGGRGGRGLLGLRRYSRIADVNNLRRNESWPTAAAAAAAATSTRRPRQSGRNISRKSRFSTQDLFGATEWECEQAAGAGTARKKERGSCCKLCGRFRFGFGIDFALSQNFESQLNMTVVLDSR